MNDIPTIDDFITDPRALYGELRNSSAATGILDAPEDVQIARVRQAFTQISSFSGHPLQHFYEQRALRKLAIALFQRNLTFSEEDIEALLMATANAGKAVFPILFIPLSQFLARVQNYVYLHGMTLKMERLMQELRDTLSTDKVEQRYARTQLYILLGRAPSSRRIVGAWKSGTTTSRTLKLSRRFSCRRLSTIRGQVNDIRGHNL